MWLSASRRKVTDTVPMSKSRNDMCAGRHSAVKSCGLKSDWTAHEFMVRFTERHDRELGRGLPRTCFKLLSAGTVIRVYKSVNVMLRAVTASLSACSQFVSPQKWKTNSGLKLEVDDSCWENPGFW
jgi:hypothetical protein